MEMTNVKKCLTKMQAVASDTPYGSDFRLLPLIRGSGVRFPARTSGLLELYVGTF